MNYIGFPKMLYKGNQYLIVNDEPEMYGAMAEDWTETHTSIAGVMPQKYLGRKPKPFMPVFETDEIKPAEVVEDVKEEVIEETKSPPIKKHRKRGRPKKKR